MSEKRKYDPRTKIIVSLCLSSLGVFVKNPFVLLGITVIGSLLALFFGAHLLKVIKRLKRMLAVFLAIIVIQSLFIGEGNVLLGFGQIKILTDVGLLRGINFLFRVVIILLSGIIISTSSENEIIYGLTQWKLPYELGFMTMMGIRFVPVLAEEFKDTMTAIQLRGVDVKALIIKEKIDLYAYILTPVVVGAISKAQALSLSAESRGFGVYDKRTSLIELNPKTRDYIMASLSIIGTIGLMILGLNNGKVL